MPFCRVYGVFIYYGYKDIQKYTDNRIKVFCIILSYWRKVHGNHWNRQLCFNNYGLGQADLWRTGCDKDSGLHEQ